MLYRSDTRTDCSFQSLGAMCVSRYPKSVVFCDLDNGFNLAFGELRVLSARCDAENSASCRNLDDIDAVLVALSDGPQSVFWAVYYAVLRSRVL